MEMPDDCLHGHSFDLTVGLRMAKLCQVMSNPVALRIMSKCMDRDHAAPLVTGAWQFDVIVGQAAVKACDAEGSDAALSMTDAG